MIPTALASVHLPVVAAFVKPLRGAQASELSAAAVTWKVTLEGAEGAISSANPLSRIEEPAASVDAVLGSTEGPPAEVCDAYRSVGLRYVVNRPYDAGLGANGFRTNENRVAA